MAETKEMDNLSREMIQCKKDGFGCHYGAWKATQKPVVFQPKPLPGVVRMVVCRHCGKEFPVYHNKYKVYCSDRCRMEGWYKIQREKRMKGAQANELSEM